MNDGDPHEDRDHRRRPRRRHGRHRPAPDRPRRHPLRTRPRAARDRHRCGRHAQRAQGASTRSAWPSPSGHTSCRRPRAGSATARGGRSWSPTPPRRRNATARPSSSTAPSCTARCAPGSPSDRVRTGTPVDDLDALTADAVVVADGINSRLRARLFPGHPGARRTGRLDLRGTLARPPGVDELLTAILIDRHSGAMFGLFPLGPSGLYWFTDAATPATDPRARTGPGPDGRADGRLAPGRAGRPAGDRRVRHPRRPDQPGWRGRWRRTRKEPRAARRRRPRHDARPRARARARRSRTPPRWSGICRTPDRREAAERLRRYDAERRPRANRLMLASSRQSRLTTRTGPGAWLRDAMLRATPPALAARQLAAIWLN